MGTTKGKNRTLGDTAISLLGFAFGLAIAWITYNIVQNGSGSENLNALDAQTVVLPIPKSGPGAASPEEAIANFLDAQLGNDPLAAFATFSEADRRRYPSPDVWSTRQLGVVGEVLEWNWQDDKPESTSLVLRSGLSTTSGWSPSAMTIRWRTVEENGWRVVLQDSLIEPVIPPETDIDQAASEWLIDETACRDLIAPMVPTAVASDPLLLEEICRDGGAISDSGVMSAKGQLASQLAQSYGPDAAVWARVVPLDQPHQTALVLAPIDNRWLVIDAVRTPLLNQPLLNQPLLNQPLSNQPLFNQSLPIQQQP